MEKVSPACPRCGSSNTKFCYYNNYSLTQPRYFCKGCRRYWTRGGSLRNVPIGGGCRKSRRGKSLRVASTDVSTRNYGQNGDASSSSLSAAHSDGNGIDLAEVYANFLNPKPQTETGMEALTLPELPEGININVTQSFDQFQGLQMNDQLSSHLAHGNFATHLLGHESNFGFSGNLFSSVNSTSNFALPPLPDVVVSEGLLWPRSILPNEVLHSTNPMAVRLVEPSGQNSEMLNASNVTPFSPLSLEAIFRS